MRSIEFARELVFHPTLPAFTDLRASTDNRLWVRDAVIRESEPVQWTVFDRSDMPVGRLTIPAGYEVLRFGPDFVFVVVRDDLDREHVRRYRLDPDTAAA